MRDTAGLYLKKQCGNTLQYHILGNHPFGYLKYNYPEEFDPKTTYNNFYYGAKLFLFEGIYLGGPVTISNGKIIDIAWVTKDELEDYLHPSLASLCQKILVR